MLKFKNLILVIFVIIAFVQFFLLGAVFLLQKNINTQVIAINDEQKQIKNSLSLQDEKLKSIHSSIIMMQSQLYRGSANQNIDDN
jgi:hypothetical protein